MLVGVTGRKFSGKDTFSDYLVKYYNFHKKSLSKPLKKSCKILFHFSEEQLNGNLKEVTDERWKVSPRKLMQYLGTEIFRKDIQKVIPGIGEDFWINWIIQDFLIKKERDPNILIAVSDVRFPNEVARIKSLGGIIIKVVRPCLNNDDLHESEQHIDNLDADIVIVNDSSLTEFYAKIDQLTFLKQSCLKNI